MSRRNMTILAGIGTFFVVVACLLVPNRLMKRSDQKMDGVVSPVDTLYYSGALDMYLRDDSFHTRLMLMTDKWDSEETSLKTSYYDFYEYAESVKWQIPADMAEEILKENSSIQSLEYIRRISLRYQDASGAEIDRPAFMARGNAVRTICNLTAFDLMPEIFNLYYNNWTMDYISVYRYTDVNFHKYRSDAAMFSFYSRQWSAGAQLFLDVETGDFVGIQVWYDAAKAEEELEKYEQKLSGADASNAELKALKEAKDWAYLFAYGETVIDGEGQETVMTPGADAEQKKQLDRDVEAFLQKIGYSVTSPVENEEELSQISAVPYISDEKKAYHADHTGEETELKYAYVVVENSSNKPFYFVISGCKGSFEAYFSPVTEKITETT